MTHELEREGSAPSLVEKGIAVTRAVRARGKPERAGKADKPFIDSLYGDEGCSLTPRR